MKVCTLKLLLQPSLTFGRISVVTDARQLRDSFKYEALANVLHFYRELASSVCTAF